MTHPIINTHLGYARIRKDKAREAVKAADVATEAVRYFATDVDRLLSRITTALPADLRAKVEAGTMDLPESVAALAARVAAPTPAKAPTPDRVTFPGIPGEWIPWAGGECPVDEGVEVEVVYRNEAEIQEWESCPDSAMEWNWACTGSEYDILAYRIVSEITTAPQPDADGWYTHDGTAWPVCGPEDEVEYVAYNGHQGSGKAGLRYWRRLADGSGILRYRPLPKT